MLKSSLAAGIASAAATTLVAAGLAAPAQASTAATSDVIIKNCSKTVAGVPLRVKMRFDDRILRVRVTHPDGTGNFRDRRVKRVATTMYFESGWVNDRIGSAAWAQSYGDRPVYRIRGWGAVTRAMVTFTLTDGKRARVTCEQRFPGASPA